MLAIRVEHDLIGRDELFRAVLAAYKLKRLLLGRQLQGGVSGTNEICIYVFCCNARLRPVGRTKVVGPLELQVILLEITDLAGVGVAAGTLIPLLEPA